MLVGFRLIARYCFVWGLESIVGRCCYPGLQQHHSSIQVAHVGRTREVSVWPSTRGDRKPSNLGDFTAGLSLRSRAILSFFSSAELASAASFAELSTRSTRSTCESIFWSFSTGERRPSMGSFGTDGAGSGRVFSIDSSTTGELQSCEQMTIDARN